MMLGTFAFSRLFRCAENSESVLSDGWTEMTTSLDRYAILATVQQFVVSIGCSWAAFERLVDTMWFPVPFKGNSGSWITNTRLSFDAFCLCSTAQTGKARDRKEHPVQGQQVVHGKGKRGVQRTCLASSLD